MLRHRMTEAEDISGCGGVGGEVCVIRAAAVAVVALLVMGRCILTVSPLYTHCILTVSSLYPHCIPPKRGVCGVLRRGKVEGGGW